MARDDLPASSTASKQHGSHPATAAEMCGKVGSEFET